MYKGHGMKRLQVTRTVCIIAMAMCAALMTTAADSQEKQINPGEHPRPPQPKPRHVYYSYGLSFQTEDAKVPVAEDGTHDPTDEAVRVLQEPYVGMKGFPRDNQGLVDWIQALEKGYINPRKGLTGKEQMFPVDFDIIFTNTRSMPYVRFPHRQHTEWLTCGNCHPLIFIPQKGGNPITMSAIIQGQFCGVCHGKVAFPPTKNCGRCHSVPQEVSVKR